MLKKWALPIKHAAIPALLLHCSIGSVYCWSLLKGDIATSIGKSVSSVEWAFSLAIFFLGVSAAFAGEMVEKDVKKSSLIAAVCFASGMALTGVSIYYKSLIGIYLSYGVLMGIGLGIGYLSPVKTLMLWFAEQKGLATGLAITGFGLAKVIASPLIISLVEKVGIIKLFFILAGMYFVLMLIASILIKKPSNWSEDEHHAIGDIREILSNKNFIAVWLILFLNITCGLALISQEKDLMKYVGLSAVLIGTVSSLTAVFNAGGRLLYSAASDKLRKRSHIYKFMLQLSAVAVAITLFTNSLDSKNALVLIALLCVVNSTYGGGFSNLPTLLSDYFGMDMISRIHGLSLTSWAMAGLCGNQLSAIIIKTTGSYNVLLGAVLVLYVLAYLVGVYLLKSIKVAS